MRKILRERSRNPNREVWESPSVSRRRGCQPPTVVNSYYGAGCYNCGGWAAAGAAATTGVALGATAATANQAESYNAGFAAGSAYALGAIYTNLPGGCVYNPVGTSTYYRCGTAWLSPAYGANGVYYRVVTAPF
ncbi:hypothetical protein [Microcystis sp. LEGE 08355]|uniref:hypothetical protein n=1 Tax=Microcystis sp. LEGE 08355 TaxID=1828687 RepID=UPI001881CADA|nr:hypothetical protein [Microcystis sp. LEGE 08355]MBE9073992.1 hypothetical protein [Microcystis sp. LEGE 08355]